MPERRDLLPFLTHLETFKSVERLTKVRHDRFEDDAQHSWHLSTALMLFRQHLPAACSMERMYELALVHDLPELVTGDYNPYRDNLNQKQQQLRDAIESLFKDLPQAEQTYLRSLIEEYEDQQTLESRIVKGMDKLLPLINALHHPSFSAYREQGITEDETYRYISTYVSGIPLLEALFEELMTDAREKGIFPEKK